MKKYSFQNVLCSNKFYINNQSTWLFSRMLKRIYQLIFDYPSYFVSVVLFHKPYIIHMKMEEGLLDRLFCGSHCCIVKSILSRLILKKQIEGWFWNAFSLSIYLSGGPSLEYLMDILLSIFLQHAGFHYSKSKHPLSESFHLKRIVTVTFYCK